MTSTPNIRYNECKRVYLSERLERAVKFSWLTSPFIKNSELNMIDLIFWSKKIAS